MLRVPEPISPLAKPPAATAARWGGGFFPKQPHVDDPPPRGPQEVPRDAAEAILAPVAVPPGSPGAVRLFGRLSGRVVRSK